MSEYQGLFQTIGYRGGEVCPPGRGFMVLMPPENAMTAGHFTGPDPRPMACLGPVDHTVRVRRRASAGQRASKSKVQQELERIAAEVADSVQHHLTDPGDVSQAVVEQWCRNMYPHAQITARPDPYQECRYIVECTFPSVPRPFGHAAVVGADGVLRDLNTGEPEPHQPPKETP